MTGVVCTIQIDSRVYGLDVVQRAAIKFTDFASFDFRLDGETALAVTVTFKAGLTVQPEDFQARFQNELLDQQLRWKVAEETKSERDLILAYAFSNTKLLGR